MDVNFIIALLILGAVVGLLAGLLGIGGGGVMVPVLTSLFAAQGFPADQTLHIALGTSMAAIVPTAYASLRTHHAKGAVLWDVVKKMTPAILAGTFLGTFLAAYLPTKALAIFFAVFMTYVAIQIWVGIKPRSQAQLPSTLSLGVAGAVIGAISALVAIGGGSLTVPYLMWNNVNIRQAIATSAAVGFPIAVAGALGYVINGWGIPNLPAHTLGFVYWPAVILIASVSFFTTKIGANLAHSLPVTILKKVFAVLVVLLSVKMLVGVL